jgi:hypothetical protein
MRSTLAAMKTALRVLSALTEKQNPDAHDVEDLRRLAPDCESLALDELACEVIQRALRTREKARSSAGE